jgi:hypothetical protein
MSDLPRIKISLDEVQDPRLDEAIDREAAARRAAGPAPGSSAAREAQKVPFYYNPVVAYGFFGAVGASIAFAVLEPSMLESHAARARGDDGVRLVALILFPLVGACIGLFVACCDAILSRNPLKALHCGAVGLGIGALSGTLGIFMGAIIFGVALQIVRSLAKGDEISGLAFFVLVVGRAMGWTFAASGMGIGQGVALKSKKLVLNGLVGGLIGGFIGGMAFDPIGKLFGGETATLSRFFGLTAIGLAVGLFTGLAESIAKDAWLYMKAGPLAGKQFVIYRDPTVLGSSPKSDIYLFKAPAIEPSHAEVRSLGTRYELRDLGSKHGIYVNGKRIQTRVLEPGDEIRLGETVLQYAERQRKSS